MVKKASIERITSQIKRAFKSGYDLQDLLNMDWKNFKKAINSKAKKSTILAYQRNIKQSVLSKTRKTIVISELRKSFKKEGWRGKRLDWIVKDVKEQLDEITKIFDTVHKEIFHFKKEKKVSGFSKKETCKFEWILDKSEIYDYNFPLVKRILLDDLDKIYNHKTHNERFNDKKIHFGFVWILKIYVEGIGYIFPKIALTVSFDYIDMRNKLLNELDNLENQLNQEYEIPSLFIYDYPDEIFDIYYIEKSTFYIFYYWK